MRAVLSGSVWEDWVFSSPLLSPPVLMLCWRGQILKAGVSGRKGQHGGCCSAFSVVEPGEKEGSTQQILPLDTLVCPDLACCLPH